MTEWRLHRQAGFSLVEMLVALAILGLVALLISAGVGRIGLSLALWNRDDTRVSALAAAQFTLRERLAGMQPVADNQAGGSVLDVAGQTETLDFVAPAPDRDEPDALRRYRLRRNPNGDLMLYSLSTLNSRVDPRGTAITGWTGERLAEGTARIAIRYWGQDPISPTSTLAWQGYWVHRSGLPILVRISVAFPDGDPRVWPDLVVRPRGALPETCPDGMVCARAGATT